MQNLMVPFANLLFVLLNFLYLLPYPAGGIRDTRSYPQAKKLAPTRLARRHDRGTSRMQDGALRNGTVESFPCADAAAG